MYISKIYFYTNFLSLYFVFLLRLHLRDSHLCKMNPCGTDTPRKWRIRCVNVTLMENTDSSAIPIQVSRFLFNSMRYLYLCKASIIRSLLCHKRVQVHCLLNLWKPFAPVAQKHVILQIHVFLAISTVSWVAGLLSLVYVIRKIRCRIPSNVTSVRQMFQKSPIVRSGQSPARRKLFTRVRTRPSSVAIILSVCIIATGVQLQNFGAVNFQLNLKIHPFPISWTLKRIPFKSAEF